LDSRQLHPTQEIQDTYSIGQRDDRCCPLKQSFEFVDNMAATVTSPTTRLLFLPIAMEASMVPNKDVRRQINRHAQKNSLRKRRNEGIARLYAAAPTPILAPAAENPIPTPQHSKDDEGLPSTANEGLSGLVAQNVVQFTSASPRSFLDTSRILNSAV
jgi:hypothetical protein